MELVKKDTAKKSSNAVASATVGCEAVPGGLEEEEEESAQQSSTTVKAPQHAEALPQREEVAATEVKKVTEA